jgi:hypothetical protein
MAAQWLRKGKAWQACGHSQNPANQAARRPALRRGSHAPVFMDK